MVGAIRVLRTTDNPSRHFVIVGRTDPDYYFVALNRSSRTYDVDVRANEAATPTYVTAQNDVNTDYNRTWVLPSGVVLRINPSAAGTELWLANEDWEGPNVVFEPEANTTARMAAVGIGATVDVDIYNDFDLGNAQPTDIVWTVATSDATHVTAVVLGPGRVRLTGVGAGSATITLTATHGRYQIAGSKTITATAS